MTSRILCIVIALMVLSISAILVANPNILGEFQSTLNGVPIKVTISPQDNVQVNTMRYRDLRQDWGEHVGRFVRFTGVVEWVDKSIRTKKVRKLTLEGYTVDVHPLDAPNLPEVYHKGHKYEFTGFLMRYEKHAQFRKSGFAAMRVYAFEIRHLGEAD